MCALNALRLVENVSLFYAFGFISGTIKFCFRRHLALTRTNRLIRQFHFWNGSVGYFCMTVPWQKAFIQP